MCLVALALNYTQYIYFMVLFGGAHGVRMVCARCAHGVRKQSKCLKKHTESKGKPFKYVQEYVKRTGEMPTAI